MENKKKILSFILFLIAILCLIGAIVLWIHYKNEDKQVNEALNSSEDTLENLSPDDTMPEETVFTPEDSLKDDSLEEITYVPNPYADKFLENEDMVGWLMIPGTNVDYPVMWTLEDENYYLYRDFDKKDNSNGSLILDTDSSLDPLTTNLIIHGHNMKSGAMFGNLTDYEDEAYYQEHKQITLYTKECARNYEIIAVFRSQVYKKSEDVFKFYKFFDAKTEEEFQNFYENIKALSLYDTGVTAQFGDHFLTLSTCVYHVKNGRFVVVAKEIAPGDSYLPIEEE